jgi:hypothetical protein
MIQLIKNQPAIKYKDYLIISDLHLGIERDYWKTGYEIPSQKQEMLARIKNLKKRANNLIILGDLKHNIQNITYKERNEVPAFIKELRNYFEKVIIIKGNHDGNLEKITSGVVKEYFIDDLAFIHGHSISKKALKAKRIIAGHTHPVYTYKNHLGIPQTRKCFIITDKILIIPAFTQLSLGSNELARPLRKYVSDEERILLDHTKVK